MENPDADGNLPLSACRWRRVRASPGRRRCARKWSGSGHARSSPSSAARSRRRCRLKRVCAARSANASPGSGTASGRTRRARTSRAVAGAARDAGADLLVAVGGGSVVDAAKVAQLCLAHSVFSAEGFDALRGKRREGAAAAELAVRVVAVPTTLSGAEFTRDRRRDRCRAQREGGLRASRLGAARGRARSAGHGAYAGGTVALDRHQRGRSRRGGSVLDQQSAACRRRFAARAAAALPAACGGPRPIPAISMRGSTA